MAHHNARHGWLVGVRSPPKYKLAVENGNPSSRKDRVYVSSDDDSEENGNGLECSGDRAKGGVNLAGGGGRSKQGEDENSSDDESDNDDDGDDLENDDEDRDEKKFKSTLKDVSRDAKRKAEWCSRHPEMCDICRERNLTCTPRAYNNPTCSSCAQRRIKCPRMTLYEIDAISSIMKIPTAQGRRYHSWWGKGKRALGKGEDLKKKEKNKEKNLEEHRNPQIMTANIKTVPKGVIKVSSTNKVNSTQATRPPSTMIRAVNPIVVIQTPSPTLKPSKPPTTRPTESSVTTLGRDFTLTVSSRSGHGTNSKVPQATLAKPGSSVQKDPAPPLRNTMSKLYGSASTTLLPPGGRITQSDSGPSSSKKTLAAAPKPNRLPKGSTVGNTLAVPVTSSPALPPPSHGTTAAGKGKGEAVSISREVQELRKERDVLQDDLREATNSLKHFKTLTERLKKESVDLKKFYEKWAEEDLEALVELRRSKTEGVDDEVEIEVTGNREANTKRKVLRMEKELEEARETIESLTEERNGIQRDHRSFVATISQCEAFLRGAVFPRHPSTSDPQQREAMVKKIVETLRVSILEDACAPGHWEAISAGARLTTFRAPRKGKVEAGPLFAEGLNGHTNEKRKLADIEDEESGSDSEDHELKRSRK